MVPLLCFLAIFLSLHRIVPGLAQSGHLPVNEKNVLVEIARQLGKKDWNISLNPCDSGSNWVTHYNPDWPLYNNYVACNCSYPGEICHVEEISLTGQDLAGVLPPSLAKLPHLKMIDLSHNYLNGTIPREWASTKLEYLSVTVNRLSGRIPSYLGNISTLVYMSLESNQFYGEVPAELGKLTNLENLLLSANNLTGVLPMELRNLKNLTKLELSSNNFTGNIPSLESWTNLEKLELQASGFEGPIPSSISVLKNLTELRITDLGGGASTFPLLQDMTKMTRLILRSCNISGTLPLYLEDFFFLMNLDLAFNRLEGELPSLGQLSTLESVHLTGNFLSGPIPQWVRKNAPLKQGIDLSYNNFSKNSTPGFCPSTANLFRSFGDRNTSDINECGTPCSRDYYSFHINCGGGATRIGDIDFDADQESGGSAKFVHRGDNWGVSNTGFFLNRMATTDENGYVAKNVSILRVRDSDLYTEARLSALSLTYYGSCLANGNYTVTLHFAEIVFRSNLSYQSLGRRLFDVYIQGELKVKDFNIEQEAGGVDKVVKLNFTALVENRYLEIRFQYAGKGTTDVPIWGTYGPLVSAISVKSDFDPPSKSKKRIFIATFAGISGLFLIAAVGYWWWNRYIQLRISREIELRGLDLRTGFTYRQIKAATDNFSPANKIGEGGFGSVYKGTLLDGTTIAVKKLSSQSRQGNFEFVNEIGMISGLQHPNLVKLYGCCIEGSQLVLVYEYMENNSLGRALFGPDECQIEIDWATRQMICVGIAKGLTYLHEESILRIVHRDIKASNVLLDKDLNPKIADFGLAKLSNDENSHISTRVAGTIGYMAPEYVMYGHLTHKADVYSFGVVALEIVAGKNNLRDQGSESLVCLLDRALVLQKRGSLMEIVDPRLGSNFDASEAEKMVRIALLCTSPSPVLRPTMCEVVEMLEGRVSIEEFNMNPSIHSSELRLQALREKYDDIFLDSSESQPPGSTSLTSENPSTSQVIPMIHCEENR